MSGADLPVRARSTTDLVYVRWHGPSAEHALRRSDLTTNLRRWVDRLLEREVPADRVTADFNNDQSGYAVANAMRLRETSAAEALRHGGTGPLTRCRRDRWSTGGRHRGPGRRRPRLRPEVFPGGLANLGRLPGPDASGAPQAGVRHGKVQFTRQGLAAAPSTDSRGHQHDSGSGAGHGARTAAGRPGIRGCPGLSEQCRRLPEPRLRVHRGLRRTRRRTALLEVNRPGVGVVGSAKGVVSGTDVAFEVNHLVASAGATAPARTSLRTSSLETSCRSRSPTGHTTRPPRRRPPSCMTWSRTAPRSRSRNVQRRPGQPAPGGEPETSSSSRSSSPTWCRSSASVTCGHCPAPSCRHRRVGQLGHGVPSAGALRRHLRLRQHRSGRRRPPQQTSASGR